MLHWQDLFTRIGPITSLHLRYGRADRSEGVAFVTYQSRSDAEEAIRQFDRANANGQPIYLTLMSAGPSAGTTRRNPFDTAQQPSRSLFDRITPASAEISRT